MTTVRAAVASVLTWALLSACQHACYNSTVESQPARLINPSAAVKLEIQQHIVQLIGGAPVTLADDVFTQSNILYIEQAVLRDNKGLPIMGRHQQPVIRITLWHENGHCVLHHAPTETSRLLSLAKCQPLSAGE